MQYYISSKNRTGFFAALQPWYCKSGKFSMEKYSVNYSDLKEIANDACIQLNFHLSCHIMTNFRNCHLKPPTCHPKLPNDRRHVRDAKDLHLLRRQGDLGYCTQPICWSCLLSHLVGSIWTSFKNLSEQLMIACINAIPSMEEDNSNIWFENYYIPWKALLP